MLVLHSTALRLTPCFFNDCFEDTAFHALTLYVPPLDAPGA